MENVKRNKFIQMLKVLTIGFWENEAGEVDIDGIITGLPKTLHAEEIYKDTAKPSSKKFGISANKGKTINPDTINKGTDGRTREIE